MHGATIRFIAGRMLKNVRPRFICIKSTYVTASVALRTDLYILQNFIHISGTTVLICTAKLVLYLAFPIDIVVNIKYVRFCRLYSSSDEEITK